MATRRNVLTFSVLALAAAASIATSPPRWTLEADATGEAVSVDDTTPTVSMHVAIAGDEIPADAYGELTVALHVLEAVDAEGAKLELDLALVEETDAGDVEHEVVEGWTLEAATEENATPEHLTLHAGDIGDSGTFRIDVTKVAGASAELDWDAYVQFEVRGEDEVAGEPSVVITLDPAE
jgi:hypothetical protein